jgi:hypothetical protein
MDLLNSSFSVGVLPVVARTISKLTKFLQLGGRFPNTVYCGRHACIPSHICAINLPKSAA